MSRFRLLRRHPRFVLALWIWGGAALAVAVAVGTLFRGGPGWPPALEPAVRPEPQLPTLWRLPWSEVAVTPGEAGIRGVNALLAGLAALAVLSLAMATVNVGALLASRRTRENRDRAIRLSLGATPRLLGRERTRHSRFLMAGAGLAGIAIGIPAVALMRASWPAGLQAPGLDGLAPGLVLLTFAALALAPRGGGRLRIDMRLLTGRTVSAVRGLSRPRARIAGIQFGLAVTVIATAGALFRSAEGVAPDGSGAVAGLAGVELRLPGDTPTIARAAFFTALLERLARSAPAGGETIASPGAWLGRGVRDVVMAECGTCARGGMLLPVQPAFVTHHMVGYGFIELLGLPLLEGRSFTPADGLDSSRVALVNETFARTGFERGRPLGRRVQVGGLAGEWYTIVGVVRDRVVRGPGAPREGAPAIYLSVHQEPPFAVTVALGTADTVAAEAEVRRVLASLEVDASLGSVTTAAQEAARATSVLAWFGGLVAALAGLALLLAMGGVAALVRDAIRARQRELAIRVALGARFRHIARSVMGDAARAVILGAAAGLMGAFTAGRYVQMRFPGVRSLDPSSFLAITAGLALLAVTTALLEARRFARAGAARALAGD
jgi:hypothetical protein